MINLKNKHSNDTIFKLLEKSSKSKNNSIAVQYKKNSSWKRLTWKDLLFEVKLLSSALSDIGVRKNDRIAILSDTRIEWLFVDLSISSLSCCTVPIYSSTSSSDISFILNDANVKIIFIENKSHIKKLRESIKIASNIPYIIFFDDLKGTSLNENELFYGDFLLKKKNIKLNNYEINNGSLLKDLSTIVYTSGTTGRPKGVMLTNSNLIYEARVIQELGILKEDDIQLLFLPLAHIFAKILEVTWLKTGHTLVIAESVEKVIENMRDIGPTFMSAVPRFYEKIHSNIINNALNSGVLKSILAKWAFNKEKEETSKKINGIKSKSISWIIAKKIVFNKISKKLHGLFGGNLRFFISGGAPLSAEIGYFFKHADIKICEGYGLTETSAATTINPENNIRLGTVGPPVPGTKVKINHDGEVLIKGDGVFHGYWNNKLATKNVLINGWFYSGDIGELDEYGYLKIIDRKKDIIITAVGKNIAPQKIENLIKLNNDIISNVIVHGDKRKFISALITLNEVLLLKWAENNNINDNYCNLCRNKIVRKNIEDVILKSNNSLASYEQIKKFQILDHDLIGDDELTPTLKIKRASIYKKYKNIFDNFYL